MRLTLSLSIVEREQAAGDFSVDLVAEDESGNPVIIENQLERSNHDHLGKLITYLTQIGAKAAIWIVADPRPEHISAISWLNESSSASFYLLKLEAVRIERFTTRTAADTDCWVPVRRAKKLAKQRKNSKNGTAFAVGFGHSCWSGLKKRTPLHANTSPNELRHIRATAGKRGLIFGYVIQQHTSEYRTVHRSR